MRHQPIKRVVDARAGQGRVIIHLACKHTVSLTDTDLMAAPRSVFLGLTVQPTTLTSWPCEICEDEPVEKTAVQLWREAGEP